MHQILFRQIFSHVSFDHLCHPSCFQDNEWFHSLWTGKRWFEQPVSALLAQACQSDI